MFRTSDFLQTWRVPLAMPHHIWVGERLFLKPLVPLIGRDDPYYLLAVSQNEVRLLSVRAGGLPKPTWIRCRQAWPRP